MSKQPNEILLLKIEHMCMLLLHNITPNSNTH